MNKSPLKKSLELLGVLTAGHPLRGGDPLLTSLPLFLIFPASHRTLQFYVSFARTRAFAFASPFTFLPMAPLLIPARLAGGGG